jgi:FlaA1/EpsC-like NDP-sugar epimerase
MVVWKYRFVPALLISLSGYIMPVLVSTTVIVCINLTQVEAYVEIKDDYILSIVTRILILLGKCGILLILYKRRLGFTFLSNYTTIPFVRENTGVFLYIIVVFIGMVYRHSFRDSVFSAVMPIQMLSMATILFIFVMLRKELSIQR